MSASTSSNRPSYVAAPRLPSIGVRALLVAGLCVVGCTERSSRDERVPSAATSASAMASTIASSGMGVGVAASRGLGDIPRDSRFAGLQPNCSDYCRQANTCRDATADGEPVDCMAACAEDGEYAAQARAFRCVGQDCAGFASCRSVQLAVDQLREAVRATPGEGTLPAGLVVPEGAHHTMTPSFGGAQVYVAMYRDTTIADLESRLLAGSAGWELATTPERAPTLRSFALRSSASEQTVLVRIQQQGNFSNLTIIQPPTGEPGAAPEPPEGAAAMVPSATEMSPAPRHAHE